MTLIAKVYSAVPSRFKMSPLAQWVIRTLLILFVLNFKSWPLLFHLRCGPPIARFWLHSAIKAVRIHLSISIKRKLEIEDEWVDSVAMVGRSPFDCRNTYRTRATIDECDINMHLSNSSYAKVADVARIHLVNFFPLLFRSGAILALGASHFHFLREIRPGQKFEIHSSIGGWDDKWLYTILKFVSKTKRSNEHSNAKGVQDAKTGYWRPQPDDQYLTHAVVVNRGCFKVGRITVPPALALASNGFCMPPSTLGGPAASSQLASTSQPHSRSNPPPHWGFVKEIVSPKHGGSAQKYREFICSGWKDVQEGERWWETALAGQIEERRAAAMRALEGLEKGLERAKSL